TSMLRDEKNPRNARLRPLRRRRPQQDAASDIAPRGSASLQEREKAMRNRKSSVQQPAAAQSASLSSHSQTPHTSSTPEFTAQRVELILQQLDALPTLSTIALRVLELTSDESSHAKDIVQLIAADPALSAKVLKLCRCSERGRGLNVTTVE